MSEQTEWHPAEPGVTRRIFAPGRSLMMMEVRFEAGATGADHSHPHEQMSYCLEGRFEFRINGAKRVLLTGEAVSIPAGALHGVTALEAGRLLDSFTPVREDLAAYAPKRPE